MHPPAAPHAAGASLRSMLIRPSQQPPTPGQSADVLIVAPPPVSRCASKSSNHVAPIITRTPINSRRRLFGLPTSPPRTALAAAHPPPAAIRTGGGCPPQAG